MNEDMVTRTGTAGVSQDVAVPAVVLAPLRWSAVFAGAAVALGLWVLLYVFGAAAGLTLIDAQNPSSARVAGIGTGVWSLVAPLISLFVGGFVAARLHPSLDRGSGALHGAVLWGLTTLAGAFLLTSVVGSLVQGVTGAAQSALSSGAADEAARAAANATQERLREAPTEALAAADTTGKVLWGAFGALLLGLAAAVGGGVVGAGAARKRMLKQPAATPPPFARPGTVHP